MQDLGQKKRIAVLLISLLFLSMVPVIAPLASADEARDANIQVTVTPNAQTINPGESGEYTVRVYNSGSNPVTVQLSTAEGQDQDCSAYTSTITQIPGPIDSGSYEEASMNVTLAQNAEGSCETTVTATAQDQPEPPEPPGQPATETATVTTTAGDGSGNAVFGVDLSMVTSSKTWGGEETTEWTLIVENTGQQQATVNLALEEDNSASGCADPDGLSPQLSETSVTLDSEESTEVLVSLDVTNEQEADKYCWEITGTVTGDPTGNTSDTQTFDITVPVLKECSLSLSKTSINVEPDGEGTLTATFTNEGNSDWTIRADAAGPKSGWVSFVGGSSGLLPYDGAGTKAFNLKVNPDDSVNAGDEQTVYIQGKDGNQVKCNAELAITVGQSFGASISMTSSQLNNIEPGTSATTSVTVENTGNGVDTFRITPSSVPSGWTVELEETLVTLDSKHTPDRKETVDVTVTLPDDALATEVVTIDLSVAPNSGGEAYDDVTLSVSVAEVHGFEADSTALTQTGKNGNEVKFPFEIENTGNVEDNFRLSVIQQTASPSWSYYFEDEAGNRFTEVSVNARETNQLFFVATVSDSDEYSTFTVRITNKGDNSNIDEDGDGIPDNQRELRFTAFLTTRDYAMDVRLEEGGLDGRTGELILAPGDEEDVGLWIRNMGNGDDTAVLELTGLNGIATRTVFNKGLPLASNNEVNVPFGYGIWDENNSSFVIDASGAPYVESTKDAMEEEMLFTLNLSQGYQVRPYEMYLQLRVEVNEATLTGEGGNLYIVVTSKSNAANRTGQATVSLSVQKFFDLDIVEPESTSFDLTYPESRSFTIQIRNDGNVETETEIFSSENLRGWKIELEDPENDCEAVSLSSLLCTIEKGEILNITVEIKPPYGAELSDTFDFTISAQPEEIGVIGRVNQQFEVTGNLEEGLFGLADDTTLTLFAGGFLLLVGLVFILGRRN
ncbi:MAG: hypothetical protein CMA99_01265 [Euryarchaeota archaeon]|nr:hypothetical protein [Euryarchaeota archaeon]